MSHQTCFVSNGLIRTAVPIKYSACFPSFSFFLTHCRTLMTAILLSNTLSRVPIGKGATAATQPRRDEAAARVGQRCPSPLVSVEVTPLKFRDRGNIWNDPRIRGHLYECTNEFESMRIFVDSSGHEHVMMNASSRTSSPPAYSSTAADLSPSSLTLASYNIFHFNKGYPYR